MASLTKVTLNMRTDDVEAVTSVARELGVTRTQVVNDAVSLLLFLRTRTQRGHTVMVRDQWGNYRPVEFKSLEP